MKPARPHARRGVTLIELVVALTLTIIVVAAATSVMFVASRALPKASDPVIRATDTTLALSLLESEAQQAIATGITPQQLTLRIPDRTGDSIPEDIIYAWDGNAGDPLTRQDAFATTDLITGVQNAVFTWTPARGNATRVGVLYLTLTLERGLILRSTVHATAEPEDSL